MERDETDLEDEETDLSGLDYITEVFVCLFCIVLCFIYRKMVEEQMCPALYKLQRIDQHPA